ncbi:MULTISPECIES: RodZ family helix-turn-helix domain-containing protein [Lactobacillus]|uniref:Helix-turn-helix domain-containing protein n=1 Tax=Lactobacillus xujianguonis TaxID=2495899 RepID=A0A437SSN3_9LACO|nr:MULTISPECIES: helix-turn-helix domain-containing protein [Lactobacillus]RVU69930.1 helix-turn-helix domain-containing protein [Lactobacillus xujianguonis]
MADIGDKLRSAREAKGLSIADIEKATKIQSRYLTAIEQNEFDKLPGDFYVRAFIRQYAQIVGLDGKELLSEYHQDVPEAKPDEYVENSIDNKSEEVRETTNNKKDLWKNYLPRIAIGLGVIIVLLVVYVLYAHLSSNNTNNTADNSNVTVSSQSSSSKKKIKPVVKKSKVKVRKVGDNQYRITGMKKNRRLVIKAGDQTINASVAINGVVQWQQSLTSAQKHTLVIPKDAQTVVVTLGNDNGTSVKVAGKRIPYVPTGSYLRLTLLIGKEKKANTQSNSNNDSNTNNGYNNSSSSTQQSSNTQRSSRTEQSSRQSSTTQSSSQQQSSSAANNNANNDGGNTNNNNGGQDNH